MQELNKMAALVRGMLRTCAVARKPCFWLGARLETTLSSISPMSAAASAVHPSSSSSFTSTSATDSVTTGDGMKTQESAGLPPLKYSVTPTGTLFDTHSFVVKLKAAGFSEVQAEHVMTVVRDVLHTSLDMSLKSCPTKADMDLASSAMMKDLNSVRSEVTMLERTRVARLQRDTEEMGKEIRNLKDMFQEEVKRIKSGISLDFNLEKSHMRESTSNLQQSIKDTHNIIGTSVADLRTQIESQKLEMIKYLAGALATIFTVILSVVLGLWRLSK